MPYLLFIVEPVGQRRERGAEAGQAVYERMLEYTAELQRRGVLLASSSLASTNEAVRLELRNGQRHLVDGPFAEAKEMVGGYFLLDVPTREQAIELAAICPAAEWATVEVRGVAACYESP